MSASATCCTLLFVPLTPAADDSIKQFTMQAIICSDRESELSCGVF